MNTFTEALERRPTALSEIAITFRVVLCNETLSKILIFVVLLFLLGFGAIYT
jgi:hypothetical protein